MIALVVAARRKYLIANRSLSPSHSNSNRVMSYGRSVSHAHTIVTWWDGRGWVGPVVGGKGRERMDGKRMRVTQVGTGAEGRQRADEP
jgi:hypothetical protein